MKRRVFVLLCLLVPVACVTPSEKKQMKDDIFNTQTRLLNLEKLLTDTSKDAKSTGENATKRIASTQAELERMSKEIAQLHGDVDALRVGVTTGQMPGTDPSKQENSLAATIAKLGERLDALEQAQEELLDAIKKAGLKGSSKKKDSHKAVASVADLQAAFDEKHYKQVTDEGPKIAKDATGADQEQARFLIAEALFKQSKWRDAALKYSELVDGKPSKKVLPTAEMRLGDCFAKLGDAATAKLYYEELIKEFPDTDEAAKAKERLAEAVSAGKQQG